MPINFHSIVSSDYGMKMNIKKTKVLKISNCKALVVKIHIEGKETEWVKNSAIYYVWLHLMPKATKKLKDGLR